MQSCRSAGYLARWVNKYIVDEESCSHRTASSMTRCRQGHELISTEPSGLGVPRPGLTAVRRWPSQLSLQLFLRLFTRL